MCNLGLTTPDPWDFRGRMGENMVIRESTSRFGPNSGDEGDAFPIAAVVLRVDLWVVASRDLDVGHRPVLVGNEGESLKTGEECERPTRGGIGLGMSTWQSVSPVASVRNEVNRTGFP